MKTKQKEWVKRYLPANIVSLVLTISLFKIVLLLTNNLVLAAFAGAIIGDNIGYYGTIIIRDILAARKDLQQKKQQYNYKTFFKTIRNLIFEFGPAESLDTYFIRPAALYFCPLVINNQTIGLVVGKYLADIIFYFPTIISYELRKKYLR